MPAPEAITGSPAQTVEMPPAPEPFAPIVLQGVDGEETDSQEAEPEPDAQNAAAG